MRKAGPLAIVVSENDKDIGVISPSDFRKYLEQHGAVPSGLFLNDLVSRFNSMKESCGEPERARIEIVKVKK